MCEIASNTGDSENFPHSGGIKNSEAFLEIPTWFSGVLFIGMFPQLTVKVSARAHWNSRVLWVLCLLSGERILRKHLVGHVVVPHKLVWAPRVMCGPHGEHGNLDCLDWFLETVDLRGIRRSCWSSTKLLLWLTTLAGEVPWFSTIVTVSFLGCWLAAMDWFPREYPSLLKAIDFHRHGSSIELGAWSGLIWGNSIVASSMLFLIACINARIHFDRKIDHLVQV